MPWFLCLAACVSFFSCATTNNPAPAAAADLPLNKAIEESAAEIAAGLPPGTRVVIAAFDSENENLSAHVMDSLTGVLADRGFEVADRRNLAYAYQDLEYRISGNAGGEAAASAGKFLGAQYVITGGLLKSGEQYHYHLVLFNTGTAAREQVIRFSVGGDPLQNLSAGLQKNLSVPLPAGYENSPSAAPRSAGNFIDQGIVSVFRSDLAAALGQFTEAINLQPGLAPAWRWRGYVYAGQGSLDHAVADYDRALALDSNFTLAYINRAHIHYSRGDLDRTIADYNQALRLDPENVDAYINRGIAYRNKGDLDRAIADYNRALRLDPDDAGAYVHRGVAYRNKGDLDRAIADYNQALHLDPENADAYINRGVAYRSRGDLDRAIADYNQVIGIAPDYALAYYNRGNAYAGKSNYDQAIADYSEALRINPAYTGAYYNRGAAYNSKGNYVRARSDWTEALRLNPGLRQARESLEMLDQAGH
jgi:tetratricopeptide (TPR) repeat protein